MTLRGKPSPMTLPDIKSTKQRLLGALVNGLTKMSVGKVRLIGEDGH